MHGWVAFVLQTHYQYGEFSASGASGHVKPQDAKPNKAVKSSANCDLETPELPQPPMDIKMEEGRAAVPVETGAASTGEL